MNQWMSDCHKGLLDIVYLAAVSVLLRAQTTFSYPSDDMGFLKEAYGKLVNFGMARSQIAKHSNLKIGLFNAVSTSRHQLQVTINTASQNQRKARWTATLGNLVPFDGAASCDAKLYWHCASNARHSRCRQVFEVGETCVPQCRWVWGRC